MGDKVSFNIQTYVIEITEAPNANNVVDIDVKIDLYSDGKEDWLTDPNLSKLSFPLRSTGGDPLPGSKQLGSTFFLSPPWKIKPFEANHTLRINGNLFSEDGSSPYTFTDGNFNVQIVSEVSSLVDSTIQQLSQIEYASFGGGVTYDPVNGLPGTGNAPNTNTPIGTLQYPSSVLADAVAIANTRGFSTMFIHGDNITINGGTDLSFFTFIGHSKLKTKLTIGASANVEHCLFENCFVEGALDGTCEFHDCGVGDVDFINGEIHDCILEGTIRLVGNTGLNIFDSRDGLAGLSTPTIDMAGGDVTLNIRNYRGGILIANNTGTTTDNISIDLIGRVLLDSTLTNPNLTIVVHGAGDVTDNSSGPTVINNSLSNKTIANTVLGETLSNYTDENTLGGRMAKLLTKIQSLYFK